MMKFGCKITHIWVCVQYLKIMIFSASDLLMWKIMCNFVGKWANVPIEKRKYLIVYERIYSIGKKIPSGVV